MIDPTDENEHPGPLDPELRALLDDTRGRDAADPAFEEAARERVLGRVEQVLDQAPGASRGGLGLRAGVVAISAVLIATLAGGTLLATRDGASQSEVAAQPVGDHARVTPGAPAPVPMPATSHGDAVPTMHVNQLPPSASPPPARAGRTSTTRPVPPAGTDLAEEYRLVEGARAKLATRDYGGALRSIREHEARFPNGQLAQERESLHIQTLVETGRIPEARERAERFRTRFPSGLLLPTVARAIASSTPDSAAR